MIHDKKTSPWAYGIGIIMMLVSTSVLAEYSQKQNKVDDKDSERQSHPHTSSDKKMQDNDHKKSSSEHDVSTDNQSESNPNVPSSSDKKGGY